MATKRSTSRAETKGRSTRVAKAAKGTTRVRRGSAVLARGSDPTGRYQTSVQTVRARSAAARREVAALLALGLGALVLLSLLSYSPLDELASRWGGEPAEVRNWIGPTGAWVADLVVSALGLTAFAAPPLLMLLALRLFQRRHARLRWGEPAGMAGVLAALALIAHLAFETVPFRGGQVEGGGLLGGLLSGLLVPRISTVGSWIVGVTGLLASARLAFGVRAVAMLRTAWSAARRGSAPVVGVAGEGARGVGRGVRGAFGGMRRHLAEAWEDWREERAVAREERRWLREQRLARLADEGNEVLAELEELEEQPGVEAFSAALPAPEAAGPLFADDDTGSDRPSLRPPSRIREVAVVSTRDARPATITGPSPEDEPVPEFAAEEDEPEAVPTSEPVDSLRGATARGVVHAELRVRAPGVKARIRPVVSGEEEAPVEAPRPRPRVVSARRRIPTHKPYELPSLELLSAPPPGTREVDEDALQAQAARLEETLEHYNVQGRVTDILPGPVVTMFEFEPAPGIKVSRIAGLENDLAMALRALKVRIVAPIPGKGAVGIEVPSAKRETVYLREILRSKAFNNEKLRLPLALGKGIDAAPVTSDMAKMPHILVAGTTGSGKSVCVNSFILSLVYRYSPADVRMILVDPKMLEFSIYDGIPHLLVPVVTSPKKAAVALNWAVQEMTRRYKVLAAMNTRGIVGYNEKAEKLQAEWAMWEASCKAGKPIDKPDCGRAAGEDSVVFRSKGGDPVGPPDKMPYIVIIIDELADLMMVARKEVEESIVRLAQMARAAGIHMLLATQRPSVDVITGLIKANFPTRLSFKVSSKVDSRTVLDANGAENLLGQGDGLFLEPGTSDVKRVHGAFVSDEEVNAVVEHLKEQGDPDYVDAVLVDPEAEDDEDYDAEERDDMYDAAVEVVVQAGKASTSLLQRRLKLGYNRAARIIDAMERAGLVGPADGARPREVYGPSYDA